MEGLGIPTEPMSEEAAALKNPLALAFIGDTVWDLLVRRRLLTTAARVNALHRQATSMVNAGAQANALTLLEPLLRRANFLELAVSELGLAERVRVVRGRAEEHRERYDVVTCRAVAPLPRLLGWCLPLVSPGGRLLALKGSSASDEVTKARPDLRRLKLTADVVELPVPGLEGEATWAVEVCR